MIDSMYVPYDRERRAFGNKWCGPDKYESWVETLVARYEKDPLDGDGQTVEVYCTAAPARFYRLKVLPSPDSINNQQAGFEITTGSGAGELAASIAEAISQGMLGFKPDGD
jgi:hypothetical protein